MVRRKGNQTAGAMLGGKFSSVSCKLSTICQSPELLQEIRDSASTLKQVQLEGWHVANLRVIRCLEEHEELPEPTQMFFYRCCTATLKETEQRDQAGTSKQARMHPSLHATFCRYWQERKRVGGFTPPSIAVGRQSISEMAQLMQINATNMIALQFRRRLYQYIRFRYPRPGEAELSRAETKRLTAACYRVKKRENEDSSGEAFGGQTSQWDNTDDVTELELRAWLGDVPWEATIRQRPTHFLRKLADMLSYMETVQLQHPHKKGTRLYSLLPLGSSFAAAFVKINTSVLRDLCGRIYKRHGYAPLEIPAEHVLDQRFYSLNRDTLMRTAFNVTALETSSRTFAREVKTNGYGASVLLQRPADREVVAPAPTKQRPTRHTKRHDDQGSDLYEHEYNQLPDGYQPRVLIGIDPGMLNLCTAVVAGSVPRRPRHNRSSSKVWRHQRRRRRKRRRGERVVKITTREYRHLAMMNKTTDWHTRLREREPKYNGVCNEMPSFKTASLALYVERLATFWTHGGYLLKFSAEHAFLKYRFLQTRMKMKALDALAKRIVPIPSSQVCIAYGDWSKREGIKGHPPGPVKGFAEALRKRATMLPMDEYKTSKLCSRCHCRLEKARLLTKDQDDRLVLRENRNVLRCANSSCRANFWNRDVNAARNMLELLSFRLMGLGRITAFVR